MEPRKKDGRWSPRGCDSGGRTEAPRWSGVEVRPGSKSTAQSHRGLLGSWESLLSARTTPPDGIEPADQGPGGAACSRLTLVCEDSEPVGLSHAECISEGVERDRGSLSLRIVAMESGVTDPREPVSSEGADRMTEASWETRMGR